MRNIISLFLLIVSFCFCDIAFAGIIEEIQAKYPKLKVSEKININDVGRELHCKELSIHVTKGDVRFWIKLESINGEKFVTSTVKYWGKDWIFFDSMKIGNGVTLIEKKPIIKPDRVVLGPNRVWEVLTFHLTRDDLEFMKNTKIIRIFSSSKGYFTLNYKDHGFDSMPYFEAIDTAIRYLDEK